MTALSVAIVGGGYAGFAAAVTLAGAGCKVTVFETARTLGGRARRIEAYGTSVDNGAHILLGAYVQTLAMLRTVHGAGAEHDLLDRRRLCLEAPGVFKLSTPPLPAPWHLATGLLCARGLSLRDRFTTLAFVRQLKSEGFRCSPDLTVAAMLQRQPQPVVRALWEPLCIAALNTPIATASAQIFLNVLDAAFSRNARDSDVLLPRVELSTLFPDAAAAYVADRGGEIRAGVTVAGIARSDDGVSLRFGFSEQRFSAAVIAVGPHQLTHLLQDTADAPDCAQALANVATFSYEPIVTAYIQYERSLGLSQPMIKLDGSPGQWIFDRGQLDGPSGLAAVVISTDIPGARTPQDTVASAIDAQLRRLMPALPPPSWIKVIAERRATYACTAGLSRPSAGMIAPHIALAGDYTNADFPATLEAATRSGVTAANALLNQAR